MWLSCGPLVLRGNEGALIYLAELKCRYTSPSRHVVGNGGHARLAWHPLQYVSFRPDPDPGEKFWGSMEVGRREQFPPAYLCGSSRASTLGRYRHAPVENWQFSSESDHTFSSPPTTKSNSLFNGTPSTLTHMIHLSRQGNRPLLTIV